MSSVIWSSKNDNNFRTKYDNLYMWGINYDMNVARYCEFAMEHDTSNIIVYLIQGHNCEECGQLCISYMLAWSI